MGDKGIKEGDKVSWSWGSGQPGGTAAKVASHGEVSVQSKRGNTIKKNADPQNPAVKVKHSGQDVVKRASELKKEGGGGGGGEKKKKEVNGDNKEEGEHKAKKQKTEGEKKGSGGGKKTSGGGKAKKQGTPPKEGDHVASRTRSRGKA